jgi:hypothetical protein
MTAKQTVLLATVSLVGKDLDQNSVPFCIVAS